MPYTLRKIPFREELVRAVQGFDCGDEDWARPLAAWIRCSDPANEDGALYCMARRKTQVWLYASEADGFVGYGSLGKTRWNVPEGSATRQYISLIPALAIHRPFQGKPSGAGVVKYADQILDHLRFEATEAVKTDGRLPLLGLFVDPRNEKAIRLYRRHGFRIYSQTSPNPNGPEFQGMVLDLT